MSNSINLPSLASATSITFIMLSCCDPTQCCNSILNAVNDSRLWLVFCRFLAFESLRNTRHRPVSLVSRASNLDMTAVDSSQASITILTLGLCPQVSTRHTSLPLQLRHNELHQPHQRHGLAAASLIPRISRERRDADVCIFWFWSLFFYCALRQRRRGNMSLSFDSSILTLRHTCGRTNLASHR